MIRIKPITVIALDPHAAAFCDGVQSRIEYDFGRRGRLTQMRALVVDGNSLRFEDNLSAVADTGFDLKDARNGTRRTKPEEATNLFDSSTASLEPALIELLSATRKAAEIETASAEAVEVTGPHVIYLVLSSCDPFASGVALRLAHLIRWLCAIRFSVEAFSLEAVVLLPEMFEHAEPLDYSAAYALLKKLDISATAGIDITAKLHEAPFHFCWLLDGRRSYAEYVGSLADSLDSYSDAFAGFLTSEPERSGALITHNVRGKKPAYSTFGHGELFFPAETAIARLSATLGRDIITLAFLVEATPNREKKRKIVLGAKQFVLSADYTSTLEGLKRDKGAEIWRNFAPSPEVREVHHREVVNELRRRRDEFERDALLNFQQTLEVRSEQIWAEMEKLLDLEIERHADATPQGLHDALGLIDMLTDPSVALQSDAITDRPQNLVTEQRGAEGTLDSQLGIAASNERTDALLDEINDLRSQLDGLRTTLRLLPASANESGDQEAPEDKSHETEADSASPDANREKALAEVKQIKERITAASTEYKSVINHEDQINRRARFEAIERVRAATAQAIIAAETKVGETGDKLSKARLTLEELQEARRQFARRYFIWYPSIALVVAFVIPGLLSIAGIAPGPALWSFYVASAGDVVLWTAVILAIYCIVVGIWFATGVNRRFAGASNEVEALRRSLKHDTIQLVRAHNDELRLEYELYAQQMSVEILLHLIEAARLKAQQIRETLRTLDATRTELIEQRERAVPAFSRMRRSVLQAAEIDAYYRRTIPDVSRQAESFAREQVKRSQVSRIPLEEFRARLGDFTIQYFKRLEGLSIEDVLLREPELISPDTADQRLRELNVASQPLLQLSDVDSNRDKLSQRDVTLWVDLGDREDVLVKYRKFCPEVTVRSHEDKRALRVLTRFLYFPAYFLGQIDYFRICYDRDSEKDADSLPDLIPSEMGLSGDVRRALEQLLLGIALGLVGQREGGNYHLVQGNKPLRGASRMQIAEELATGFTSVQLYKELCETVKRGASDNNFVYDKLAEFQKTATDLERDEDEVLQTLLKKYHPLR